MIRIRENRWISLGSIESIFVKDGGLQIKMVGNELLSYLVENKFFVETCKALNLPCSIIQGITARQRQEKEHGKEERERLYRRQKEHGKE